MQLRRARLIPDSETPLGEGRGAARRALAEVDGEIRAIVLKRLPPLRVAADCFCALVLQGWGLPVPQPVLVEGHGHLWFGSLDAGYPNLKQRLGWDEAWPDSVKELLILRAADVVGRWPETPRAIAADEAIGNLDRNLGNLLWDGESCAFIEP